ncbi:hypothetical protein Poli38472_007447 [Pythium oligandrum]|uniref:ATP-dependent DNA helicase n=1 Tax=Pythium oligandrum TaxID=41045 RepID=A0A8K1CS74_PYTOL|nr:hypothetical protein Poli38472_007447 [Pythium oligandrum]|eukprot:TMW67775.1 hypothetical protein Poli38472_007447 [Pythium oligandrum]
MTTLLAVRCELEYQEADARTGRNLVTSTCTATTILKRRSGLEVVSEKPVLRKAIKMQEQRYEVYFRFIQQGKIAFIRRESTRVYQFNIRNGDTDELADLVRFSIRLGAVPKTPMTLMPSVSARPPTTPSTPLRREATTGVRRPLREISNMRERPTPSPKAKRQRTGASSTAIQARLTEDQQRVIDLIKSRCNVFFTGSAGTGKSFLLQQILQPNGPLRSYLQGKRIYATATTGIAAYNINGMTLHHFAGLDPRAASAGMKEVLVHVRRNRDALQRWRTADVLVIDEVSMLDGRLFDTLEALARELRPEHHQRFFGGIQLVLSGDFFQLPPVASRNERDKMTLCFESSAWQSGIDEIVQLSQVFRQTNTAFVDILNAFRVGQPSRAMLDNLNERCTRSIGTNEEDDDDAIRIFTHNNDVLEINSKRLDELPSKKFNYISADTGKREYLAGCPAPPTLSLKKHARVMLIKTINPASGLVNGCRGVITGFTPQTQLPIVRFSNGLTEIVRQEDFPVRVADSLLASRRQLPLTLAWAISIHKSQGLSFPSAVVDLSRVFEFGQAYVALSRVRSLEGLRLRTRLDARSLVLADQRVLRFYEEMRV